MSRNWPIASNAGDYLALLLFSIPLALEVWWPELPFAPYAVAVLHVWCVVVLVRTLAVDSYLTGKAEWAAEFAGAVGSLHRMAYGFIDSKNAEAARTCCAKLLLIQEATAGDPDAMDWMSTTLNRYRVRAAGATIYGVVVCAGSAGFAYYLELSSYAVVAFLACAWLRISIGSNVYRIRQSLAIVDAVFTDDAVRKEIERPF